MALTHLLLYARKPHRVVYALAVLMAVAGATSAVSELFLMFASDISAYAGTLKYQVLSAFVIVVALVWFIYLYYGTASRALALTISAMWLVSVVPRLFVPGDGLLFSEISALGANPLAGNIKIVPSAFVSPIEADLAEVTAALSRWGIGLRAVLNKAQTPAAQVAPVRHDEART